MKKVLITLLSVAVAACLCACGSGDKKSSSESASAAESSQATSSGNTGNADKFVMSQKQVASTLQGTWGNQEHYRDKLQFDENLGFTHFMDKEKHYGTAVLDENSGMLEITYDDDYLPKKSYVWVDSLGNVSANTWYVDGGTFAFGDKVYIRDMEF